MPVIGNERVVVLNAPLVQDQYRNWVRDWDAAMSTAVARVTIDPDSQAETTTANDQNVVTQKAFMPLSAPVDEFSRVLWDGVTWEVDGRPARFRGGPLAYQAVTLKQVTG